MFMCLGMLNDYRIFDYRIKCSFSFSFVLHSILGNTVLRTHAPAKARSVQASCLFTLHADLSSTPRKSASPPSPPLSIAANTQVQAVTLGVSLNKRNAGQREWVGGRGVSRLSRGLSASIVWFQLTRPERRRHGHLKYMTKLLLPTRRCRSCQRRAYRDLSTAKSAHSIDRQARLVTWCGWSMMLHGARNNSKTHYTQLKVYYKQYINQVRI